MNKKNILAAGIMSATLIFSVSPIFAADTYGLGRLVTQETKAVNSSTQSAQRNSTLLSNLKLRLDKAIDNRITVLNRLNQRVAANTSLISDDKTLLEQEIQSSTSELTQLKAGIDSSTDITMLRSDIKQIYAQKVYVVAEPKIRLLLIIDDLTALNTRLQNLTPKIQSLINSLKSEGKDVTTLQNLLNDINSQLSTTSAKLGSDHAQVLAVTTTTTDPQAIFTSVRKDLAQVRQSYAKIRSDIGQMRGAFKGAIHNTTAGPVASSSAVSSAVPTPH